MTDHDDDEPPPRPEPTDNQLREVTEWPPFPFRYATTIPLPVRRDPRRAVMRILDGLLGGVSWVSPRAFARLTEAISRCDAGDLEGSLAEANRAAEEEPALRPLALIVARMCVHKQLAVGEHAA